MTVEQNVLQQHSQKHQQTLLNQLKEVTGTTDIQLLQQALQVSNGDLAEAVAFLTEKNAKVPQQDEPTYYQTSQVANDRYISVGSQADTNVIDLTGDDKDDLQRAIALSLEESSRAFRETGITDEEQAISRVLEASIAENKASLKRSHTEVWSDSPDPHDRKRTDTCPVGLKNVGNTCWFSAVIQSLFNLLEFQRLVLHYSPPARVQDLPRNQKEHRNLPFMQELRNLFSLMVGSKRKYVDPSRAVDILKDAFKSSESQQQDVSEFTHKLLDWLEDAFQMKAEEDREGEKPKNPMVELFYGRFLAVNGFKDLHECLEAAMIEGEIESLHSADNSARSGQEHWFTELPPVLTFELSRFEFNQALGRPEKIHNKLEFPSMLYMDRFPLADVLQYAMEFASSKRCALPVEDIDTSAPPVAPRGNASPTKGPSPVPPPPQGGAAGPQQRATQVHKPFTQSRLLPDLPMHPAPRHITEEELRVLEGCLHRWRSEVENDTRDLQGSISRLHRTIELMYSDKSMMQANAGHYWAYIYDPHQRRWMKYNDVSVTKSTWEELVRDSFGGYRNASAYCLMYINDKKPFLIEEEFDKETGHVLSGLDKLPPDLRRFVLQDNELFDKEVQEWDALQARKAQQEKLALAAAVAAATAANAATAAAADAAPTASMGSGDTSSTTSSSSPQPMSIESSPPDNTDQGDASPETLLSAAMLTPNMQGIIMAIGKSSNVFEKSGPEAAFFKAIKVEYSRLLRFAEEDAASDNDYRLQHALVYFILNQAPKKILERSLLTQFADRNLAFDERETTTLLMIGLEMFQKANYVEALMYLVYSYQYNNELVSKGPYRGHDEAFLSHFRRECLLKLNEQAAGMFEAAEDPDVTTGLGIMNELVVPCIPLLLAQDAEKDLLAVEDMRNRWCSYLGQEMEAHLQEKLTDFLPKLLDCSTEIKGFHEPPKVPAYSTLELCERFSLIMASVATALTEGR
ncbi:hypothetical protein CRUP_017725 [Coryphaenoides rupestris]|nr:hypothetical protein CRUP_017725 [Coryphaenoides rupestris]